MNDRTVSEEECPMGQRSDHHCLGTNLAKDEGQNETINHQDAIFTVLVPIGWRRKRRPTFKYDEVCHRYETVSSGR